MPPRRSTTTAFKPPRRTTSPSRISKPTKSKSNGKRRSTANSSPSPSSHSSSDAEENNRNEESTYLDTTNLPSSPSVSPDPDQTQDDYDITANAPPSIPPSLLSRLVHHFLPTSPINPNRNTTTTKKTSKGGTRLNKDAMALMGKYIETFTREAIARAAFERAQTLAEMEKSGSKVVRGPGDDFLEVEDLEKLAPQLLLDF